MSEKPSIHFKLSGSENCYHIKQKNGSFFDTNRLDKAPYCGTGRDDLIFLRLDSDFDSKAENHFINNTTGYLSLDIIIDMDYTIRHCYVKWNKSKWRWDNIKEETKHFKDKTVLKHSFDFIKYIQINLDLNNHEGFSMYSNWRYRKELQTDEQIRKDITTNIIQWLESKFSLHYCNRVTKQQEETKKMEQRAKDEYDLVEAITNNQVTKLYVRNCDHNYFEIESPISGQKLFMENTRKINFVKFLKENGFEEISPNSNYYVRGSRLPF